LSLSLRNPNIFSMESIWSAQVKKPTPSVEQMFSLLKTNLYTFEYSNLNSNTFEELEHSLNLAKRNVRNFGTLYFASHGQKGSLGVSFSTQEVITMEELAELMGYRFKSWAVHFASCSTLNTDPETIKAFMNKTGIPMLTGYTKDVDWLESTSLELLFFYYLQSYYEDLANFREVWYNRYEQLSNQNGFKWILKGDL